MARCKICGKFIWLWQEVQEEIVAYGSEFTHLVCLDKAKEEKKENRKKKNHAQMSEGSNQPEKQVEEKESLNKREEPNNAVMAGDESDALKAEEAIPSPTVEEEQDERPTA